MWETWVQFLDWEDPLRRKWQPTPVFLPRESHGRRRLVGYSPRVANSRTQLSDFTFTFTLMRTARFICVCVLTLCSVSLVLMAILLCLATIWFRPATILLELDFLFQGSQEHLSRPSLTPDTEEKGKKDLKLHLALCLSKYVLVCLCLWVIFLRLICMWALFIWLKKKGKRLQIK